jgi:hypothetical protein
MTEPSPHENAKPLIRAAIEEAERIFSQTDDVVSRERARRIVNGLKLALEALA